MRKVTAQDIPAVGKIFRFAKASLAAQGIEQWHNVYPDEDTVRDDIPQGIGYVYEQDSQIAAYVAITTGEEPDYLEIDGKWLTDGSRYATIHRIAMAEEFRGQGIGKKVFCAAEEVASSAACKSIRVDTHPDNKIMQRLITSCGYTHCGQFYLKSGDEAGGLRFCYEKLL